MDAEKVKKIKRILNRNRDRVFSRALMSMDKIM